MAIVNGNAFHIPLADNVIQCVCTSPPYFGLRSYGAGSAEIGAEKSVQEYITNMVEVFREVKRVLRKDGVCFLNIGDSYAGSGQGVMGDGSQVGGVKQRTNAGSMNGLFGAKRKAENGLKPKDLCLVPQRLAIALQDDGWWVRSEITWAKNNPMPESVTDRCTRSHETIWMLTKNAHYFYDAQAVSEPAQMWSGHAAGFERNGKSTEFVIPNQTAAQHRLDRTPRKHNGTRNRRDVWTISTAPFKGAHYATFPIELPRICILAGTSEVGCCPECGAPWTRTMKRTDRVDTSARGSRFDAGKTGEVAGDRVQKGDRHIKETTGWRPTCKCGREDTVPCLVLDPFSGASTSGVAAKRLGRRYIGIELSPEYTKMSVERIESDAPPKAKGTKKRRIISDKQLAFNFPKDEPAKFADDVQLELPMMP